MTLQWIFNEFNPDPREKVQYPYKRHVHYYCILHCGSVYRPSKHKMDVQHLVAEFMLDSEKNRFAGESYGSYSCIQDVLSCLLARLAKEAPSPVGVDRSDGAGECSTAFE